LHRPLPPSTDPNDREGIQSVVTAATILQVLGRLGQPLSLSAISRESGVTTSQARRYLTSLVSEGLAHHNPDTALYDLGPEATMLGLAALSRTDAVRQTGVVISEFVRRTGRTVMVCTLAPLGPTIIDWHNGTPPVIPALALGSALPLLHSATGHVFIAFAPENEVKALVERELEWAGEDGYDLEALRTRVREQGFASLATALSPGLRSTAFPIFDLQGRPILAAAVMASEAISTRGDARVSEEFGAACAEISKRLGYTPADPPVRL
jgi:DNA-binding IclR family transcriptional regulator